MLKGLSNHTINKIWKASYIESLLRPTFKISKDRCFGEKFWHVTGLYCHASGPN